MYFIITVDTEGDNLWSWHEGQPISTRNTEFIPKFQDLCEEFGFAPTYLTNYEMAMDSKWVQYGSAKARAGKCEIGMHLHAWNSPPDFPLRKAAGGNAYITEYPEEIIDAKVGYMVRLLSNRFEIPITSNRSGRWATNDAYFHALKRHGIIADCSVTPGIDLSALAGYSENCGNDYRKAPAAPYEVIPGLVEVPMTTRKIYSPVGIKLKTRLRNAVMGKELWFRPMQLSVYVKKLIDIVEKEHKCDYMEYMIHSSELMPGGSPYFKDEAAAERLFCDMRQLFSMLAAKNFRGITLSDYVKEVYR